MYLARKRINGKMHYYIRETVAGDGKRLQSRELLHLGLDPSEYIIYPGGCSFYIDELIQEKLSATGVDAGQEELEDIFWPFLKPDVRRALEPFRSRGKSKKRGRMSSKKEEKLRADTHIFDKRRMHYLKFGRMNQEYVGRMSGKLLRDLDGKSRDEIEQYFWKMEKQVLKFHELKIYVYVIFNLQRRFTEMAAKQAPEIIDECQLDDCFLNELCRLNGSEKFWAGVPHEKCLREYMVRYLVMFFDHDFAERNLAGDIFRDFVNRYRKFPGYPVKNAVSMEQASGMLEVSEETLKNITKKELISLYRKLARKHHPDGGGGHEKFISLTEAFHSVMRKRHFKS